MPLDPNILLGARGVEVPNPIDVAKQGLSLADLSAQNQLRQYALQTQADIPNAMQSIQGVTDPEQAAQILMRDHPRAAQTLVPLIRDLALKQAQTKEALGKGTEAQANAFKSGIQSAANIANGIVQSGQVDPMTAQQLIAQTVHAYKAGGIDTSGINFPSVMASPDALLGFAKAIQFAGTTPLDATHMKEIIEGTIPEKKAQANLANVTAGLKPFEAQTGRMSAGAAVQTAATGAARQQFGEATTYTSPISGDVTRILPGNALNPAGSTAPIVGGTGIAPSGIDTEILAAQKPRFQKATEDAATYNKVLQTLPLLKATLQSGYNGPLSGSDSGKQALAILSQIPGISGMVDMNKLANTKAADAIQGELIGSLIKEISQRGSNMATNVVLARKPGTENPLEANMRMIDALEADSRNGLAQSKSLFDYARANPKDIALSNYTAPTPDLPDWLKQEAPQKTSGQPAAAMTTAKTRPDPKTLNEGDVVTDKKTKQRWIVKSGTYQPYP